MHDTTALAPPVSAARDYTPADNPGFVKLHRRFPTVAYLRRHARRHVPRFAFEYMDGGAGSDGGIERNWSALDAVELVPRYGVTTALPPVDIELFGRRYAAPIGVAPMGGPSLVWPGADQLLAAACQRANLPYTLGLVGGMTVERAAEIAPDVLWFQLYRCSRNQHAIGFDLVRRAEACGVNVLVLTLDVPVRTTRSREVAKYRERWKRPLVVKGILHPADAEKCVALGVDGIIVSNHGGRQVEGLPAPIDVLPAIARAVGGRATVMLDSGVRSGLDVVRAVALGADAAFAGKAFLWGLGALGAEGPLHVIDLIIDEMKSAFGQIGALRPAQARSAVIRHPGALHF